MLGASVVVAFLSLVSGLLSFLNQTILAKMFGASLQMDAFLAATSIPTLVSGAFCGAMSFTITPHLVGQRIHGSSYERYGGMLFLSLLVLLSLVFLMGFLCAPAILALQIPGLPPTVMAKAVAISKVAWATGIIAIAMVYLACVLNVADHFILPAAVGTLPYLFTGIFALGLGTRVGLLSVSLGLLAGSAAATSVLLYFASKSIRLFDWLPSGVPDMVRYTGQVPLYLLAMLCFTAYQSIDTFWGARLGVGNLASLGYAQRILIAVGNLVISGPSAVLMPQLARAYHEANEEAFLALVKRIVKLVLACAAFPALAVALLATPMVRLLFARGAFDLAAVARLAGILPFLLTGMVSMLAVTILFRVLFAQKSVVGPAAIGILCASSYFLLCGWLSPRLGLKGIGVAYIISWSIGLLASLGAIWRKRLGLIFAREDLVFLLKLLASLALIGTAMEVAIRWSQAPMGSAHGPALLGWITALGGSAFVLFWIMTLHVFRIPEIVLLHAHFKNMVGFRSSFRRPGGPP
jgi:putative peptidoglycan lipid II flippase